MSPRFTHVGAIALAVDDFDRACRFYTETLGLEPAYEGGVRVGNFVGVTILMFKTDPPAKPSAALNPRITLETTDSPGLESELRGKGVTIPDPVRDYDGFLVGSFLDSEGNKLWFCSDPAKR